MLDERDNPMEISSSVNEDLEVNKKNQCRQNEILLFLIIHQHIGRITKIPLLSSVNFISSVI